MIKGIEGLGSGQVDPRPKALGLSTIPKSPEKHAGRWGVEIVELSFSVEIHVKNMASAA